MRGDYRGKVFFFFKFIVVFPQQQKLFFFSKEQKKAISLRAIFTKYFIQIMGIDSI